MTSENGYEPQILAFACHHCAYAAADLAGSMRLQYPPNVKVIEVVLDHLAYEWNAEAIQDNHPHLSLAQVYAALAWYYDHQTEMDVEIERQEERLQGLRAAAAPSALHRRLAAQRRRA